MPSPRRSAETSGQFKDPKNVAETALLLMLRAEANRSDAIAVLAALREEQQVLMELVGHALDEGMTEEEAAILQEAHQKSKARGVLEDRLTQDHLLEIGLAQIVRDERVAPHFNEHLIDLLHESGRIVRDTFKVTVPTGGTVDLSTAIESGIVDMKLRSQAPDDDLTLRRALRNIAIHYGPTASKK